MTTRVPAEPGPYAFDPETTALVVIDMQRDFLEPGGFGSALGNDVALLSAAVEPLERALAAARGLGTTGVHTGVRPGLAAPRGSGSARGNAGAPWRAGAEPLQRVLAAARELGMTVIH